MTDPFPTMKWEDYHQQTPSTAIYPGVGQGTLLAVMYCALGLASEAGEVAGQVKKILRDDGDIEAVRIGRIGKELGDVAWYFSQIIHELGLSDGEIFHTNASKLAERAATGTIQGDGEERTVEHFPPNFVPRGICRFCGKAYRLHLMVEPSHAFSPFPILPSPLAAQLFGGENPEFYSPPDQIGDGSTRYAVAFIPEHGRFQGAQVTRVFAIEGDDKVASELCRQHFGEGTEVLSVELLDQ